MNAGDTAWVLISTVLVFVMTPGLAFFYGGLVRRKNVLSILMQCFIIMCVISLQWVLYGYSLAFGPDTGWGLIGGLSWAGLSGVGGSPNGDYASTIPPLAFMMFQAMFAIITPALIIGAFAERVRFSAFLVMTVLWATLVYDPLAHWVWGSGGWMRNLGALDFAGGIVVHVSSGISALVMAILLGKRIGYEKEPFRPHNLPFTVLGGALLWFGWFGFNPGSTLSGTTPDIAHIAVTTNLAAAAGAFGGLFLTWLRFGKPDVSLTLNGTLGGLVGITAGTAAVDPVGAVIIGLLSGCVTALGVELMGKVFKIDDPVGAVSVHALSGAFGTIMVGFFAVDGGLFYGGGGEQLLTQVIGVAAVFAWTVAAAAVLFGILKATIGLRVSEEEESEGLDIGEHGIRAYGDFVMRGSEVH